MRGESKGLILDLCRKGVSIAVTVFLVLSVNFVTFMVLPGDAYNTIIPRGASPILAQRITDEVRLDEPLWVQYADYIADTLTGDFRVGTSHLVGADIQDFIWESVGNTLTLLVFALLGSLAIGMVVERIVAARRGRALRMASRGLALALLSVPALMLAMEMIYLSLDLGLGLPIGGDGTGPQPEDTVTQMSDFLEAAILPMITILLSTSGLALLMFREANRASKDAGTKEGPWHVSYASGLIRMRPMAHFYVAWTMSVVLLVDIPFRYRGLGSLMWDAITTHDILLMMAVVFVTSMMVLSASSALSLFLHLVAGRRLREALADWGSKDVVPSLQAAAATPEVVDWNVWTGSVWKGFRSGLAGLSALIVLLALLVAGLMAPYLATVPDPTNFANFEPTVWPDWTNPLPPSLDRSPYSGMLHPLGTDNIGMDVYSLWLYAADGAVINALILAIGSVVLGVLIGIVAARTAGMTGLPAKVIDFLLTPVARTMIVIPLLVFAAARALAFGPSDSILVFLIVAFYAWAWMLIVRPVRAKARTAGQKVNLSWMMPSVFAESLLVAKFAVPLIMITHFSRYAIGLGTPVHDDWGAMAESALAWSAHIREDWHLIVPPVVGMMLVCACPFVLLDRAEHAVRATTSHPSGRR